MPISLKSFGLPPQSVQVRVLEAAQGWKAGFLGGGRVVCAVYVLPDARMFGLRQNLKAK